MKKIFRFIKNYKLFSVAIVALIVGLILQLLKLQTIAHWVLSVVAIIEVLPLLWGMWDDVRTGTYGIDILAITAIVASVILKQYWAAIVVVIMLTGGEALEDYAEKSAQSELDSLLSNAPRTATVIKKGKTLTVNVKDINLGDKIIIKPGEVVPVDAVIIEGRANFNESLVTGESLPVLRENGESIISGTINIDGAITAKATATYEDSQYEQIVKMVTGASKSGSPFVRLADRYSLPFTITAYAIALAVWVLSGHAIRFLEVIIVATPCPLILAAPIALISGMARASHYGIIIKNGGTMERLAEAKTFAFDKTGTLTTGELSVKNVQAFNKFKNEDVLRLAASLAQNSNHVLSKAILADAKIKQVKLIKAKHLEEVAGLGLKASIKGREILVGNLKLLEESEVSLPSKFKEISIDSTATYVADNGELTGVIEFTDEIRSQSKATIEELERLGVKNILMVTGDNKVAARVVASAVGIDKVEAEALPANKLHIIEKLKPRPVVFVGDGVNDAPVLTTSDVGIALGAKGSTAASESADMVIMLDDIGRVATAKDIAKKTFSIANQSILIGIFLSLILMLIFATGKFKPLYGAIAQEVIDIFVIFNALRAHSIKPLMVNEQESND
jgi:heavy metal translocating P-type ATPase